MVEEQEELTGKARADLRNEQLKLLLKDWEGDRDRLYDEISFKKGQVDLVEEMIRRAFEMVIDVNKEEQKNEEERINARFDLLKKQQEKEEEEKRQEEAKRIHEEKQKAGESRRLRPEEKAADVAERKTEAKAKKGK